ncbi:hypothetical protein ANCDUO_10795 [Ancylostoma duodenale]|uniref:Uncharacterized protein n=1 Tax=Ancylostoma duodenale TaxID=51022 RepID=A0A0C2CQF5_9BILA|nr:hypothetical protein ANCDUO_10795 [Ancylostoma duodenale]
MCQDYDAHLVSIHSRKENAFVSGNLCIYTVFETGRKHDRRWDFLNHDTVVEGFVCKRRRSYGKGKM